MAEVIFKNFYGGVADSSREETNQKFDFIKHFDIYADPKKLTPIPTIDANNSGLTADTHRPGNFLLYGSAVYALCRKGSSPNNFTKIYQNTDTNAAWLASTTAEDSNDNVSPNYITFIEYNGKFFGIRGSRYIWKWSTTFTEVDQDIGSSETPSTNGIIGKANGYLYIPSTNKLWQYDNTTWTQANITIPTSEAIVGLENYGNYLAILTKTNSDASSSKSYIYLWDFSSLNATEILELPDAGYRVLGSVGGALMAVGSKQVSNGVEISITSYSGGTYQVLWNRTFPSTVSLVSGVVRTLGNKMFFALNDYNSTSGVYGPYQGIWCVGKGNSRYPLSVSMIYDYLESGGTESKIVNFLVNPFDSSASGNKGVYIVTEDYKIHKINGITYATVAPISYFETTKFRAKSNGKMRAVSCSYTPLPSAGSITVSYKIDSDSSWTDIFTDSTDNSMRYDATVVESTGVALPLTFKEIQFRVKSLGGAEPTELKFKWEEVPNDYDNG